MVQEVNLSDLPSVPVIVGPTAVGKTAVGVLIAEKLGGEVVSIDSRQIYRGMAIGTGAPSEDELSRVRHHFIGEIDPDEEISAGAFAKAARKRIAEIASRGVMPILVGGSGLYFRAVVDGLAEIPAGESETRRQIEREIDQQGMETMIEKLREVDPDYAETVGVNDRKRLVRALSVWRDTGRSFTSWHEEQEQASSFPAVWFGLARSREELRCIIETRIRAMLEAGWMDEVRSLIRRYEGDSLPRSVSEGLGYRSILKHLERETDEEEAFDQINIATRQFAKRQMTWFRSDERVLWNEASGSEAVTIWTDWIIKEMRKRSNLDG